MLSKVVHFFFGRSPDIFNKQGQVVHKLPKDKWDAWEDNYRDKDHDWKKHTGTLKPKN